MKSIEAWRQEAAELRGATGKMLAPENAEALKDDQRQFIAAILGRVEAFVLEAKADIVETMIAAAGSADPVMVKRRSIMEKNDAIRKAAASGNWVEFDRLTSAGEQPSG